MKCVVWSVGDTAPVDAEHLAVGAVVGMSGCRAGNPVSEVTSRSGVSAVGSLEVPSWRVPRALSVVQVRRRARFTNLLGEGLDGMPKFIEMLDKQSHIGFQLGLSVEEVSGRIQGRAGSDPLEHQTGAADEHHDCIQFLNAERVLVRLVDGLGVGLPKNGHRLVTIADVVQA